MVGMRKGGTVEMPAYGRRGKPKAGFPLPPQSLEIAQSAIPTFPQPRRGAEKWKTKGTFPTFPLVVYIFQTNQKGDLAAVASRPASGSFFNENMLLGDAERPLCQWPRREEKPTACP